MSLTMGGFLNYLKMFHFYNFVAPFNVQIHLGFKKLLNFSILKGSLLLRFSILDMELLQVICQKEINNIVPPRIGHQIFSTIDDQMDVSSIQMKFCHVFNLNSKLTNHLWTIWKPCWMKHNKV